MVTLISRSPEETFALGERWAAEAQAGWVFGLTGELGTGKTQLAKGLAHGLGSRDRVHSPTFALLHEYSGGRLTLFHLDLYRLSGPNEVRAAGLEEFLFHPAGIAVVEWFERWAGESESAGKQERGIRLRQVSFEMLNNGERRIGYEDLSA